MNTKSNLAGVIFAHKDAPTVLVLENWKRPSLSNTHVFNNIRRSFNQFHLDDFLVDHLFIVLFEVSQRTKRVRSFSRLDFVQSKNWIFLRLLRAWISLFNGFINRSFHIQEVRNLSQFYRLSSNLFSTFFLTGKVGESLQCFWDWRFWLSTVVLIFIYPSLNDPLVVFISILKFL